MAKRKNEEVDSSEAKNGSITEQEAALYDRQIRLWGLDSQKRLRESNLLIVGLNGLAAEVVKNIALSGVKSITLMDNSPVTEYDQCAQFFIAGSELGVSRAEASRAAIQELNSNVKISVDTDNIMEKGEDFFGTFTVVMVTNLPVNDMCAINQICHSKKVQFFCGETWGFYGYYFVDLLSHLYTVNKIILNNQKEEKNTFDDSQFHTFQYSLLRNSLEMTVDKSKARKLSKVFVLMHVLNNFCVEKGRFPSPKHRESDIEALKQFKAPVCDKLGYDPEKLDDDMFNFAFGELSPVCAAVGGILANDIVKGITGKGIPTQNFFLFDGINCDGIVELFV